MWEQTFWIRLLLAQELRMTFDKWLNKTKDFTHLKKQSGQKEADRMGESFARCSLDCRLISRIQNIGEYPE